MKAKNILILLVFLIFFATLVSATPDVNLLSPQSNESYPVGTSVTIDFNVSDFDNNRLVIDINYSATATQGTGTVISQDLNLTSTYCTDQDWGDGMGLGSACAVSWDTSDVPAGCYTVSNSGSFTVTACNYYLLLDVNNGSLTQAVSSDFNAGSSYITITQTSTVSVDLDNVTTLINNSTTLSDFVMKGVKDQGEIIGIAIGLSIGITLLIILIFSIIKAIPRIIENVKRIR